MKAKKSSFAVLVTVLMLAGPVSAGECWYSVKDHYVDAFGQRHLYSDKEMRVRVAEAEKSACGKKTTKIAGKTTAKSIEKAIGMELTPQAIAFLKKIGRI